MLFHGLYVLHDEDPRILAVWDSQVIDYLKSVKFNEPTYILIHIPWNHANPKRMLKKWLEIWNLRGGNKKPLLFTNSDEEDQYRRWYGIPGTKAISYIYTNERNYGIQKADKKYDAVYSAQLKTFKRLELAREIERLFILTYESNKSEWDLHSFCPELKHADFNRSWFDMKQKALIYNQSSVGLCLSAEEGPMLASFEYMLTGLPVVSTESLGGRHEYYNNEFSRIVKPHSGAVKRAVSELIAKGIDREFIRSETIRKLRADRERYVGFVADYILKNSGEILAEDLLYQKFFHDPERNFVDESSLEEEIVSINA